MNAVTTNDGPHECGHYKRTDRMNAVTTNDGPHECGHYKRTAYPRRPHVIAAPNAMSSVPVTA